MSDQDRRIDDDRIRQILDHLNSWDEQMDRKLKPMQELIERHEETLFKGNGQPAMSVRLDRLEQIEDSRKWHIRAIWGGLIGVGFKFVAGMFK
jgi:hypothetical protein